MNATETGAPRLPTKQVPDVRRVYTAKIGR